MRVFIFYLNAYSEMAPFVNYGATDAPATATANSLSAIGGGASTDTLPGDPNASHDDDDTTEGFANYYKSARDAQPTGILKDIFVPWARFTRRGHQWELFLPCKVTHAERERAEVQERARLDGRRHVRPTARNRHRAAASCARPPSPPPAAARPAAPPSCRRPRARALPSRAAGLIRRRRGPRRRRAVSRGVDTAGARARKKLAALPEVVPRANSAHALAILRASSSSERTETPARTQAQPRTKPFSSNDV